MICKNCNSEIPDGSRFCLNCGSPVQQEKKPSAFKMGIKNLFAKFMLFEGKSKRAEFNFGLLFIYIILQVVAMFVLVPYLTESMLAAIEGNLNYEYSGLINPIYLMTMIIAVIMLVFITAPIYRRFNDCWNSKKVATILTIVFVLGELTSFAVYIPNIENIFMGIVSILLTILSYTSTILFFVAMLKKSYKE